MSALSLSLPQSSTRWGKGFAAGGHCPFEGRPVGDLPCTRPSRRHWISTASPWCVPCAGGSQKSIPEASLEELCQAAAPLSTSLSTKKDSLVYVLCVLDAAWGFLGGEAPARRRPVGGVNRSAPPGALGPPGVWPDGVCPVQNWCDSSRRTRMSALAGTTIASGVVRFCEHGGDGDKKVGEREIAWRKGGRCWLRLIRRMQV